MNKDILKGHWKEMKGDIKQKWGKITEDEFTQIEGSYEKLEGILQQKYGYQKEKAQEEIDSFVDNSKWAE